MLDLPVWSLLFFCVPWGSLSCSQQWVRAAHETGDGESGWITVSHMEKKEKVQGWGWRCIYWVGNGDGDKGGDRTQKHNGEQSSICSSAALST